MDKFELLCLLEAISNYAYDIHYTAEGRFFFSDHLFSERLSDIDVKDDYIETFFLGKSEEAPASADIARKVADLTPQITDNTQDNFKRLRDLIIRALMGIQQYKGTKGEEDLLGSVAHILQRHNGLLYRQLTYKPEEIENSKWEEEEHPRDSIGRFTDKNEKELSKADRIKRLHEKLFGKSEKDSEQDLEEFEKILDEFHDENKEYYEKKDKYEETKKLLKKYKEELSYNQEQRDALKTRSTQRDVFYFGYGDKKYIDRIDFPQRFDKNASIVLYKMGEKIYIPLADWESNQLKPLGYLRQRQTDAGYEDFFTLDKSVKTERKNSNEDWRDVVSEEDTTQTLENEKIDTNGRHHDDDGKFCKKDMVSENKEEKETVKHISHISGKELGEYTGDRKDFFKKFEKYYKKYISGTHENNPIIGEVIFENSDTIGETEHNNRFTPENLKYIVGVPDLVKHSRDVTPEDLKHYKKKVLGAWRIKGLIQIVDEEPRMVEVVVLEKTDKKKYYTFDARKDEEKQNSLPLVNTAAGSFKAVNSAYEYNIAFID